MKHCKLTDMLDYVKLVCDLNRDMACLNARKSAGIPWLNVMAQLQPTTQSEVSPALHQKLINHDFDYRHSAATP